MKFTLDDVDGVSVEAAANMFVNGRCAFRTSDDKWGAVDAQGNVVIEPKYEDVMIFVSDEALVKDINSGKWVIIDRNGNEIAEINRDISASGFLSTVTPVWRLKMMMTPDMPWWIRRVS